jgi:hypothetical protein
MPSRSKIASHAVIEVRGNAAASAKKKFAALVASEAHRGKQSRARDPEELIKKNCLTAPRRLLANRGRTLIC